MNFFNSAYAGIPPWDVGRPQREIVQLAEEGETSGKVLDVGCGTGENALYLAGLGFEVWGIDRAPTAIEKAKDKASKRGITANFIVYNALELQLLKNKFETVIDCGLFHIFSDEERPIFASSLSFVLCPGRKYFMLCFSDRKPGSWGPRRVGQAEIQATFSKGWMINYIREARFETNLDPNGSHAWLSSITRL